MGFFSRTSPSDSSANSPAKQPVKSAGTATGHAPATGNNVVNLLRSKWRNRHKDLNLSPSTNPSTTSLHNSRPSKTPARTSPPTSSKNDSDMHASTSTATMHRQSTDALTLTLAQRLSELATANSEGLLDDDEYRVLRQSVFDRFAGNEPVPSEVPMIPHSSTTMRRSRSRRAQDSESRPPSTVNLSITSNAPSLISQFGSIVRRGSKRTRAPLQNLNASNDARPNDSRDPEISSILSHPQHLPGRRTSGNFSRSQATTSTQHILSHSLSSNSIRNVGSAFGSKAGHTPTWHQASDAKSISSMRTGHTARSAHAPSSFRLGGNMTGSGIMEASIYDEGSFKTSADVKVAIGELEKEMKGLMDAFKGLEVSIQVNSQDQTSSTGPYGSGFAPWGSALSLSTEDGTETGTPAQKNPSRSNVSRSGSRMTRNKSPFPIGRSSTNHTPHPSQSSNTSQIPEESTQPSLIATPPSPQTKPPNLSLSIASPGKESISQAGKGKLLPSPPVERPSLSTSNSSTSAHMRSTVMARKRSGTMVSHNSHLSSSMNSMAIDMTASDSGIAGMGGNDELSEVRRRRAEVGRRYEARLDFLRAKLKGMEMRERLSRT